jgi:hypothetical protein
MSIEILSEASLSHVSGASGSNTIAVLVGPTWPTSMLSNYLTRTFERLAPGGADDGTWSQIGAAGMTA